MQMRALWALAALGAAACGGVIGCGGCSSPHGTMIAPPPGDGGGNPDGPPPPPPSDAGPVSGTLRVDPVNPRYFTAGHGAVYLTGSHTWGNFKDRAAVDPPPMFGYKAFLDFLVLHRHNFFRLWTWEQPHSSDNVPLFFTPWPWPRSGKAMASDGKPQFDLDQFDETYFGRMRDRVMQARDRGIYVSIMLFDGWDLTGDNYNVTGGFPMAKDNNVNGVMTTPKDFLSLSDPAITKRQEDYITKVIDKVNDLDNVLYEIANETDNAPAAIAWQYHMVDFVKTYEKTKPKQHPVGMTSTYPGTDADLYAADNHADWISPNTRLASSDGTRVVLNDTDHSYGWSDLKHDLPAGQQAWAWETFCRGAQPVFMDPYLEVWTGRNTPKDSMPDPLPDPYWDTLRDALGYTALYASKLDLERAVPSNSLCSTTYCLVDPGHQYLVYQPDHGSFQLTVTAGRYSLEWFDPTARQKTDGGMMTLTAGRQMFTPPGFAADAVLLLTAQ